MKILLADDQLDTLKLYELAFGVYGHSVRTANDAKAAIAAVEEEMFDVLIIDVEMPGLTGWEAIRAIRQLPNGQDVPIAIYTAYYTQRDMHIAYAVGANILFTKPMMPDEVNRRLEGICAASRNSSNK